MQIGKKIKYDNYGRITLPVELAELLDLIRGEDEVTWNLENGKIYLHKVTKTYYGGFDFESGEIEKRLRNYEKKYFDDYNDNENDPIVVEKRAREEYEKDKVARAALKKRKTNTENIE